MASILLAPDALLRAQCDRVEIFSGMQGALAMELLGAMYRAEGRGLAAPQIGVTQRMFVIDTSWKEGAPRPMVFVNPQITDAAAETATGEERCLSIPDHAVDVTRPVWIDLRWQDLTGAPMEGRFSGFDAVCIQHERDHLDGVLITDHEAD